MISVLHLITGLDTGGAETTLVRLVTRLDRTKFASRVISLTATGTCGRDLARIGVPVTAIGMTHGRPTPREIWRLYTAIRRARPTIVQTWLPHADLLGFIVGRLAGARTVCWNVRSAELDRADHPASLFWVLRLLALLSGGPACIVSNSVAGRRAHEAFGYRPKRWELIPNGFDTDTFAPSLERRAAFRQRLGLSNDAALIGLVARYHPMKDHRTFIDAAALVAQVVPGARFLMVGRGIRADTPGVQEGLANHRLESVMHLEGECPNAALVFPALDIAILSSYSEAFPNVVGEAMACGVPCVVTDVGDAARLVGNTGIVVPPRDPVALADGILRLLALDGQARTTLGFAARERIATEYSVEAMVGRYEHLYSDLANQSTTLQAHPICVG